MTYIGIDPGAKGAIAILSEDGLLTEDTPYHNGEYDIRAMAHILSIYRGYSDVIALIEDVHAMPGNGSIGSFKLGRGKGLWEGICGGVGITTKLVSSQRWKAAMLGKGKHTKADSLDLARNLFPRNAKDFRLQKHDGRAEAALIAEYGRRIHAQ